MNQFRHKHTFKKEERLCSRKAIEQLIASGSSIKHYPLRAKFIITKHEANVLVQVVFSVPKRLFPKAVDRNLLKRRMREAYRLQKPELYQCLSGLTGQVHIMIIYSDKRKNSFHQISESMSVLVKKIGTAL